MGEGEGAGSITELPSIIFKSYLCPPWLDFSMRITNGMLYFCTKHPWVINIFFPDLRRTHGETRNLTDPPKSEDSSTRWLVHKAQCPTTDAEQFRRRDNGMLVFYCCHIPPCYFLPNQLNIACVRARLRWPSVSIWNWGLKIVERK